MPAMVMCKRRLTNTNIGGEFPESIALSILAEIHAFINQAYGSSLSGVLTLSPAELRGVA